MLSSLYLLSLLYTVDRDYTRPSVLVLGPPLKDDSKTAEFQAICVTYHKNKWFQKKFVEVYMLEINR